MKYKDIQINWIGFHNGGTSVEVTVPREVWSEKDRCYVDLVLREWEDLK